MWSRGGLTSPEYSGPWAVSKPCPVEARSLAISSSPSTVAPRACSLQPQSSYYILRLSRSWTRREARQLVTSKQHWPQNYVPLFEKLDNDVYHNEENGVDGEQLLNEKIPLASLALGSELLIHVVG